MYFDKSLDFHYQFYQYQIKPFLKTLTCKRSSQIHTEYNFQHSNIIYACTLRLQILNKCNFSAPTLNRDMKYINYPQPSHK